MMTRNAQSRAAASAWFLARVLVGALAFCLAGCAAAIGQFTDRAEAQVARQLATGHGQGFPVDARSFLDAADRSPLISASELDAFRMQVMQCWSFPSGWTDPSQSSVTLRFKLNRDGSVQGTPIVESYAAGPFGAAAAASAVRAVLACGPYKLPADRYDQWSNVQISFRPAS